MEHTTSSVAWLRNAVDGHHLHSAMLSNIRNRQALGVFFFLESKGRRGGV